MRREWGRFWVALAVIMLAVGLIANLEIGNQINIGPMGQWASAIGTATAVWFAIRNNTASMEAADRRELLKMRTADLTYCSALHKLGESLTFTVKGIDGLASGKPIAPALFTALVDIHDLAGSVAAIDRFPMHTAPGRDVVIALIALRTAAHNLLTTMTTAGKASAPVTLNFAGEVKLISGVTDVLADTVAAHQRRLAV